MTCIEGIAFYLNGFGIHRDDDDDSDGEDDNDDGDDGVTDNHNRTSLRG